VGYREPRRVETSDGLPQVFAIHHCPRTAGEYRLRPNQGVRSDRQR
jgi:hypothetical protein